ncbi:MAG: hypothetical protein PHZ00_00555 [Candidatus Peribacteraceae bacterium]|nr:hypothetical protein [Candidatus Peribacteraceae bacterium]
MNDSSPKYSYVKDGGSCSYAACADAYATRWSSGFRDPAYEYGVNSNLNAFLIELAEQGIGIRDAHLLHCGPGVGMTDLDSRSITMLGGSNRKGKVMEVDWSPKILGDAHTNLLKRGLRPEHIVLAQDDFSDGHCTRFDNVVSPQVGLITCAQDLRNFSSWLSDNACSEKIASHNISTPRNGVVDQNASDIVDEGGLEYLATQQKENGNVRVAVANLVLDGYHFEEEASFRERVAELRDNHLVGDDDVRDALEAWHQIVAENVEYVSLQFLTKLFRLFPEARLFAAVQLNVTYSGIDTFQRINMDRLRRLLFQHNGIELVQDTEAIKLNDSEDPIPHIHAVGVFKGRVRLKEEVSIVPSIQSETISEETRGSVA